MIPLFRMGTVATSIGRVVLGATRVLLHFNGTNGATTTQDSSGYSNVVTLSGSATISTANSKFGGASLLLNGTSGYATVADSPSLTLSGDLTVEGWFYATSISTNRSLFTMGAGPLWEVYIQGSSGGKLNLYNSFNGLVILGVVPTTNAWHHFAWTREGAVHKLWLDGTLLGSYTDTGAPAIDPTSIWIGSFQGSTEFFAGNIDDFRVTSSALYTGAGPFTPPTSEFPDPFGHDANFSTVQLLLRGEGTNASTTFVDDSSFARSVDSVVANCSIVTADFKYGAGSIAFTNGRIYYPAAAFAFGSSDFTIESWVKYEGASGSRAFIFGAGDTSGGDGRVSLFRDTNGIVRMTATVGGTTYTADSASGLAAGSDWTHVACVRSGTNLTVFLNGVPGTAVTTGGGSVAAATTKWAVGAVGEYVAGGYDTVTGDRWVGKLDEFRISLTARYTLTFAPPSQPFPGSA